MAAVSLMVASSAQQGEHQSAWAYPLGIADPVWVTFNLEIDAPSSVSDRAAAFDGADIPLLDVLESEASSFDTPLLETHVLAEPASTHRGLAGRAAHARCVLARRAARFERGPPDVLAPDDDDVALHGSWDADVSGLPEANQQPAPPPQVLLPFVPQPEAEFSEYVAELDAAEAAAPAALAILAAPAAPTAPAAPAPQGHGIGWRLRRGVALRRTLS